MSIFKCKMCGGTLEINNNESVATCEYCGTQQTLPKVTDDQRAALFNRGNHFRRIGEFDKALAIYENIVREDDSDAEAHWCCALCRFGIEYVEDPNTYEFIPTCHRASFDSFLEDVDYLAALEHSDGITKRQYQKDAVKIADVQRGILATSQNEEPYDVFICYKETDDSTKERTRDSLDAQEIYYQLTQAGYRVFFSRITLEDKVGAEYEPYIFAALNSAKVMVSIGSKPEYFNAVWVKNEWSRFLAMMRRDRSKLLLPCYKGMDPYDLPEQLGVLQSYDMAKIGFMQDLIRGIKKVLKKDEPKQAVKETVVVKSGSSNVAPLLKRGMLALEDGEWDKANEYFDQALNGDAECADAYLGFLMAELQVHRRGDLKNQKQPFDENGNFKKAVRFGDEKQKAELNGYITFINERNKNEVYDRAVSAMKAAKTEDDYKKASEIFQEILGWRDADKLANECLEKAESARKDIIYNSALNSLNNAATENEYKEAGKLFRTIPGWRDADKLAEQCLVKAEECRKDAIYSKAVNIMGKASAESEYKEAAGEFKSISGWKDADELYEKCQNKIEENKAREEAERAERERKAEEERIAKGKKREKRKKIIKFVAAIGIPAVCILIAFLVIVNTVIIPGSKYDSATDLYNAGKFEEAITAFRELKNFKDSAEQVTKCETAIKDGKYNAAVELYNSGKFDEAITVFKELNEYKDSKTQISKCETAIKDSKYNAAVTLIEKGDIINAYESLIALNGYKDSTKKANDIFSQYKKAQLKASAIGDVVCFGAYEQDNNTSNGKEDIDWLVLAKEGDKALLISKYALDCQPYHTPYTSYTDVTWETCSLRKWLNGTFLNAAFSESERAMIPSVTVSSEKKDTYHTTISTTTDRVFLLSITEANKYFSSDSERMCAPTDYAKAHGAITSDKYKTGGSATCWWWLRSLRLDGFNQPEYAACVLYGGYIKDEGEDVSNDSGNAVRPALWINLKS